MGCYVNPNGNKKDWLDNNGKFICEVKNPTDNFVETPVYLGLCNNNRLPVVLVDNGSFYAAGVCFDEREYDRFVKSFDRRPRTLYTCDKELLKTVVDTPEYIQ